MAQSNGSVGQTQQFVLAKGFQQVGDLTALVGHDGSPRVFAELTADPDHLGVRPNEAYQALLASMQPGWVLRVLQISWPDAEPRQAFREQVSGWGAAADNSDGRELLHQGMALFLDEAPLPYTRRTILEFVALTEEAQAWWTGLPGLGAVFGVRVKPLCREEIETLAQRIFNPDLE